MLREEPEWSVLGEYVGGEQEMCEGKVRGKVVVWVGSKFEESFFKIKEIMNFKLYSHLL